MKVILTVKPFLLLACKLTFQFLVLRLHATGKHFSADLFFFYFVKLYSITILEKDV